MRQQRGGGGPNVRRLQNEKKDVTVREFPIRGEQVEFRFAKGKDPDSGREFREVTATIPGKEPNAVVYFTLQVPEKSYDEDEVLKMIRSIK